ncbi:MAG TPA: hypothetical protein VKQ73_18130 [Stellaceae bacterium]|nr:hypothetical protein [Stellaceae bacterium]
MESQSLGPDPSLPRGRDARGRFAAGSSGNPRGRPPGIANPRRRVADLAASGLSPQALADLLGRKPYLLRPIAALLPPRAASDPARRLGIDLKSLRTPEDILRALGSAWTAVSRGRIAPAEGALIARRLRTRMRALRPGAPEARR